MMNTRLTVYGRLLIQNVCAAILVCVVAGFTPAISSAAGLIYAYGAEAVSLDVADTIDGPSFDVIYNVHEGLVDFSENGDIVPVLAKNWSLSGDQLQWTFKLRDDVTFQDGTKFNAQAVKFNFDRVMDPAKAHANLKQWEPYVESVDVVDDYTVRITTKKPYGSLLSLLASDFGKIMNSPTAVEKFGKDYGRNTVGTGPFMLKSWTPGVKLVIEKYPNYWRGAPVLDSVEYRPSPEGSARVLALEGGDVDLINQVPAQDLARFQKDDDIQLQHKTTSRLFYWAYNHTKDVWSDPKIRLALNLAVNRESIVKNILYGSGEVSNSYISPSVAGSIPIDVYGYNPNKARKLLEEAKFPFDEALTLYATEGRYYQDRQIAEAIQGMLAEVGVKFNIEIIEWGAFVDAVWFTPADNPDAKARDAVQTSYGTLDPPTWMRQTLVTSAWPKQGFNEAFYSNKEVDRLVEAANQSTDLDERKVILGKIQKHLIEDPPWLITHFEQKVVAHKSNVKGLFLTPQGRVGFRLASVQ